MRHLRKCAALGLWYLAPTGEEARAQTPIAWVDQASGTLERLRGVRAVDDRTAWATGQRGTILRTVDSGEIWARRPIPDTTDLDFRDVEAPDATTAIVLSIGPGDRSRIYRTTDGGDRWTLSYQASDPRVFINAIAFFDADHGLALGDPVDGHFVVLRTTDGGRTWSPISPIAMPASLPGEGAFAASGTCLVAGAEDRAWFVTGGGPSPRVFRTVDGGRSWQVAAVPAEAGDPSRGMFSVAVDPRVGIGLAVGGDYRQVDNPRCNVARSDDLGKTWTLPDPERPNARPGGFRSAIAFLPGSGGRDLLAVGPGGSDDSRDGGSTWTATNLGTGFHALSIEPSGRVAWAVGEAGKVARVRLRP